MIQRIVISESQYKRLFFNEQMYDKPWLRGKGTEDYYSGKYHKSNSKTVETEKDSSEGSITDVPVRMPDMTKGWLSYDGQKGKYAYLFGGEPFHISYFCKDYTSFGGYAGKLSLPNKEIEEFRDLILDINMTPKSYENVGFNREYSKKLYSGGGGGVTGAMLYKDRLVAKIKHFRDVYVKTGRFDQNKWSDEERENFIKMLNTFVGFAKTRDVMCPYVTINELGKGLVKHFFDLIYEYRHEIIDVLAVVAYFFGPIGVGISIALEAINGGLYAMEGDWTSAILSWVFMAIPATGPLARRLTAPVVKNIVKYFKNLAKINKELNEKVVKKKISDLNKTLSKTERDIVEQMTDPKVIKEITELNKSNAKKKVIDNIKQDPKLYEEYLRWERGFGKGSKFLKELLNPTALEKFIYAGSILGSIYLDKSGKMEDFGQYVVEKLVDLGWVDADISEEEKQAIEEGMNEVWEKYYTPDFGDPAITKEKRDKLAMDFLTEVDTTTNLIKKVYENDLPGKVELIKSELPVKEKLLKKLEGVSDDNLRDFDNYKWAQLCKGKNKLSVSSNITPEIEEFLNDDMFNIRRIKDNSLGKDYEYASDEDGLWYFKKLNTTEWKLVTDCMALLKIETAMEKDLDSDIDTEGEIFDLYRNDIDIEYKDF